MQFRFFFLGDLVVTFTVNRLFLSAAWFSNCFLSYFVFVARTQPPAFVKTEIASYVTIELAGGNCVC
jgi:hypothetical protein